MSDIANATDRYNSCAIIETSHKLIPLWDQNSVKILSEETNNDPKDFLDSFFLFPLDEVSVNSDCKNVPQFINERFQNILSAANKSNLSVALTLSSQNGRIKVHIGFQKDSKSDVDSELFRSIVNGIFPGKNIKLADGVKFSSLANGCKFGGMITGVPIIKNKDANSQFNLSSIARSLYGKNYLLTIISRPVSEQEIHKSFDEMIQIRDKMHALAVQTVGFERGTGSSTSETETSTMDISKTKGIATTNGHGFGLYFIGSYSRNSSEAETEGWSASISKSKGETKNLSENQSSSISVERLNGHAVELEKIADHYIERMIQGLSSGYWETSITFATDDEISSEILAGTFVGELSKPNEKLQLPPRIYLGSLGEKVLFVPIDSTSNSLFPKSLASYITSEELALVSSPPTESIPGYEVQKMPQLALSDNAIPSEMVLGNIADHGNPIGDSKLYLSKKDLNKHLFVCGLTGSGKTTTVKHILLDIVKKEKIPFLILESAKRDYRRLLGNDAFKDNLNIFTIGDATVSPIRFNPFYIQKGVHPLVHIDYLKAIFNASFSLYGPMPSIVEKCLHAIYIKKGWDLTFGIHPNFTDRNGDFDEKQYSFDEHYYCFPTLADLKDEVDRYIKTELDYKGELRDNIRTAIIVRLESLCVGAKGLMFNTHDFFSMDKLLKKNIILELESLADDDDKAFFVGLVLVFISQYRQNEEPEVDPKLIKKGLQHFMVIEEAHRLLKNVDTERSSEMIGNPKGKAVEVFCNILAEMRSLGQGVAIVEQIPSKISPDVIKNSNTKIVHRLVSRDDQSLLAGALGIGDYDALYLNRLKTGHALCHKEGMGRPAECSVLNDVDSHAFSNSEVKRLMKEAIDFKHLHNYKAYEIDSWLGEAGTELCIRFFNSLITVKPMYIKQLITTAHKRLSKLIIERGMECKADDLQDYLNLQIMVLLNRGLYTRSNAMPAKLKEIVSSAISNESPEKNRETLTATLNQLWEPFIASAYIVDIIVNLTIQYIHKKNRKFTQEVIESVVSSFLLCTDNDLTQNIAHKILKKVGGVHG